MLDTSTKRRIDDCRDILVGKLPDPKSQIEQITIGLIYKFMDDMDKEAIELGGEAKFFSGDFEKYSWDNLFNTKVTAHDMLKLYAESIEKMEKNPHIPQLFRDIFKNAYLPYRDPETLKLFLKTIGEFEYTHSEVLGDAYEYLLSIMGSQGDAGQFRTPRHIIDFLVRAVNPQKNDTILDPACGTAGFLVSAFKHIINKHNQELTPEERKRLIKNFIGYDISLDMVRMSQVNLYLHGFSDPNITEYDTLTKEYLWDETFDVVLANPPFMSPKGGIRPHKRFTVTSNRSEVLFVDYITEHLNPNGRAGVIVPEGIIFQSGKAYKELRKMLVENYLYAVVSLPAGVFNPYSGVKTSILLMDKTLAKKTDKILFVKIDNDGYNLGAQRNAVKGGQLNEALEIINDYKLKIEKTDEFENIPIAHAVEKAKIVGNGEYNLSGERYKTTELTDSKYDMIDLSNEDIFKIVSGGTPSSSNKEFWNGDINWATLKDLPANESISKIKSTVRKITEEGLKKSSAKLCPINSILVSTRATIGRIAINKVECSTNQGFKNIIINDLTKAQPYFIALMMTNLINKMNSMATGGTFKELSTSNFKTLEIPLPPLSVQEEIVAEIEGYQKIIDGAKMVVDNYKPHIDIGPDWEMRTIKELSILITKGSSPKWQGVNYTTKENGILFITSENVGKGMLLLKKKKYVEKKFNNIEKKSILKRNDILTNIVGASIGRTALFNLETVANINQAVCIIRPNIQIVNPLYLMYFLNSKFFISLLFGNKVENARANVSMGVLSNLKIPLPPLKDQQRIVNYIEKEQELVNSSKQLISIFEQKIKDRIAKVWGE